MPKRSGDYVEGLLEDLKDPVAAMHYLNAAIEDSREMFILALRDVALAHRMAKVALDTGLSRESLYRALSEEGNPRSDTLFGILKAVKIKIRFEAEDQPEPIREIVLSSVDHRETQISTGSIFEFPAHELSASTATGAANFGNDISVGPLGPSEQIGAASTENQAGRIESIRNFFDGRSKPQLNNQIPYEVLAGVK